MSRFAIVPRISAFIISNRVDNPDRTRTLFVHILSDLSQEIDNSKAFEIAGSGRVRTFNGKVFAFVDETQEVIRYGLDEDLRLAEERKFSVGGTGILNLYRVTPSGGFEKMTEVTSGFIDAVIRIQ